VLLTSAKLSATSLRRAASPAPLGHRPPRRPRPHREVHTPARGRPRNAKRFGGKVLAQRYEEEARQLLVRPGHNCAVRALALCGGDCRVGCDWVVKVLTVCHHQEDVGPLVAESKSGQTAV